VISEKWIKSVIYLPIIHIGRMNIQPTMSTILFSDQPVEYESPILIYQTIMKNYLILAVVLVQQLTITIN
jgi:hypothetical protein